MSESPEIHFLSNDDVIQLQNDTLEVEGGMGGVRDEGLLQSALSMPMQKFGGAYLHEDLAAMAAAYLFHLAKNHAFHDGNKRVALAACLVFPYANGHWCDTSPVELRNVTLGVAAGEISKEELTAWLRGAVKAL